eukprot:8598714-Prorocentrum_lima.AAC.1
MEPTKAPACRTALAAASGPHGVGLGSAPPCTWARAQGKKGWRHGASGRVRPPTDGFPAFRQQRTRT